MKSVGQIIIISYLKINSKYWEMRNKNFIYNIWCSGGIFVKIIYSAKFENID